MLNNETLRILKKYLDKELTTFGSLPVPREDLTGEVLLRVIAANASRPLESPFAYARTVLRNLICDHIGRFERAQKALKTIAAEQHHPRKARHCDCNAVEDRELVGYLLTNTSLTPLQEHVIRLRYLSGRSISEIARELSRNPGTVSQHHDRAIRKLAARAATLGVV